jgi:hypothetical protein
MRPSRLRLPSASGLRPPQPRANPTSLYQVSRLQRGTVCYHPGLGYAVTDHETGAKILFPDVAALLGKSLNKAAANDEFDPNINRNFDYPSAMAAVQFARDKTGQNWELVSVNDLRSWIRGCPATEWGRQCGVYDDCSSSSCHDETCNDGCWGGFGPHPDGGYCVDFFPSGTCSGFYWASTPVYAEDPAYDGWRWNVGYEWANIGTCQPNWKPDMRVLFMVK